MGLNLGIVASSKASAAPSTLLLDTYSGAAAAYSLRLLRTAYTGSAIRVRRSSDNALQDIGFDGGGNLNTSALTTFVGANNGFVTIWYDQSGNANHAIQNQVADQPTIVNLGTIVILNSKPALQVNFGDFFYTSVTINCALRTTFSVYKRLSNASYFFPYGATFGTSGLTEYILGNIYYRENPGVLLTSTTADTTANQILISGYNSSSSIAFQYKNNLIISSTSSAFSRPGGISLLLSYNNSNPSLNSEGNFQELIIYATNNSANLSAINTNINLYYSIF